MAVTLICTTFGVLIFGDLTKAEESKTLVWWTVLWNGNGTKVLLSSNKSIESSDELENYIIELEYK